MNTDKKDKTIFGFTIGPIYEMMSHSKKTRELWFSSYFFSFYMRKLFEELQKKFKIIIPQINLALLPASKAGFFPDHIIGSCTNMTKDEAIEKISAVNETVKKYFKNILNGVIDSETKRPVTLKKKTVTRVAAIKKDDVDDILDYYLQTKFVCLEFGNDKKQNEIIEEIEKRLFTLESNRTFTLGKNKDTCYRCKILPSVVNVAEPNDSPEEYDLCPFCFIKLRAHHCSEITILTTLNKDRPFQSVGEISAGELKEKYPLIFEKLKRGEIEDLDENDFKLPKKRETKSDLKDYHKYLAIIQADGDSLGNILKETNAPETLSINLFNFSIEANKVLADYGAEPIYLGGDDLLIFAPVYYKGKSVLDLTARISEIYSQNVKSNNIPPTISFGINIFYYKSPLSGALKDVHYQLNNIAKKEDGKNSLALLLTQHSGQQTSLIFKNTSNELVIFKELLTGLLNGSMKYPQGIHHNLMRYKRILTNLNSADQLKNFQENRFNEQIHETFEGIDLVFELLEKMLATGSNGFKKMLTGASAEQKFDEFISQLRFIKFLAGEE